MRISFQCFGDQINNFYRYMGRDKKPNPETKDLWFKKIKGYQETEIIDAFDMMKDSLDSIPFNIPKAVKKAVVSVNMSKCTLNLEWKNYGPCDGCCGSGGFRIEFFDKFGNRSTPIQYCSQCDNWRNYCNDPGNRISENELVGAGYKFKPLNKVLILSPKKAIGVGSVDKLKKLATGSVGRFE